MRGTVDGGIHAEDAQLAAGRLRHAPDHAHGRRLARAVRAEEPERLTRLDVEVDAVDRDEAAEPLGDVGALDQGLGARRHERRRYRFAARPRRALSTMNEAPDAVTPLSSIRDRRR